MGNIRQVNRIEIQIVHKYLTKTRKGATEITPSPITTTVQAVVRLS
jgi:hypothetical protein